MENFKSLFAPFLVGDHPRDNGDWTAYCPQHEDPATSNKPSAYINFDKGIWWCFATCFPEKKEARLSALAATLKKRIADGEIDASELPPGPDTQVPARSSAKPRSAKRPVPTEEQVSSWQETLADNPTRMRWLTEKRGLTADAIAAWKIGYSSMLHRFTFPVYSDGKLVDARCRAWDPDASTDKYVWWRGGNEPPLFGEHMVDSSAKYVVVFEGELDCILAWQMGIPAVTGTAGAGTWKMHWTRYFANKEVFFCYDPDKAGKQGRAAATRSVREVARAVYWIDLAA